jgi:hypothetical protein
MALATVFYEYVPPANQVPNAFASFMSAYMQVRTPFTMELFRARLRAMDPSARDAYLGKLADNETEVLRQIAMNQRESEKNRTDLDLSDKESARTAVTAEVNHATNATNASIANQRAMTDLAVEDSQADTARRRMETDVSLGNLESRTSRDLAQKVGPKGDELLVEFEKMLGSFGPKVQEAQNDPARLAEVLRSFDQRMSDHADVVEGTLSDQELLAYNRTAVARMQGFTGADPGKGKAGMRVLVENAFPREASMAVEDAPQPDPVAPLTPTRGAGAPSLDRLHQGVVTIGEDLRDRGLGGGGTKTSTTTSSSTGTGSRETAPPPDPAEPDFLAKPDVSALRSPPPPRGAASTASSTTAPPPATLDPSLVELLGRLERIQVERERVLSEDPLDRLGGFHDPLPRSASAAAPRAAGSAEERDFRKETRKSDRQDTQAMRESERRRKQARKFAESEAG